MPVRISTSSGSSSSATRWMFARASRRKVGPRPAAALWSAYDFRPWVDGPSDVTLKFARPRRRQRHAWKPASTSRDAVLAMDFLKWNKPAGTPGQGALKLPPERRPADRHHRSRDRRGGIRNRRRRRLRAGRQEHRQAVAEEGEYRQERHHRPGRRLLRQRHQCLGRRRHPWTSSPGWAERDKPVTPARARLPTS